MTHLARFEVKAEEEVTMLTRAFLKQKSQLVSFTMTFEE